MFIITAIIATSLLLLYTAYLLIMLMYWKKATHISSIGTETTKTVSVIVPFRNEENNLEPLIKCLDEQTFPKSQVKFILVDDHSADSGVETANKLIEGKSEFVLIQLEGESGKKAALRKGISSSKGELIVTMDADVLVDKKWLQLIVCSQEQKGYDMLILPVMIEPANGFIQQLQQLDFFNLAGLTGASAKMNSALMCNGANLCFTRKVYNKVAATVKHKEIASGDDMFLLLAMKKNKKDIGYFFHNDVIARTAPSESLKSFISQRIRWAAKAKFMSDRHIILSGLLITLANLSLIVLAVLCLIGKVHLGLFLSMFLLKAFVDFVYLRAVASSFGKNASPINSFVLSIVYPFYVLIMPLLIVFIPAKWKGRRTMNYR